MNKEEKTKICFRIDLDIAEQLKEKAEDEYMTTSSFIRKLIIENLKGV